MFTVYEWAPALPQATFALVQRKVRSPVLQSSATVLQVHLRALQVPLHEPSTWQSVTLSNAVMLMLLMVAQLVKRDMIG